MNGLLAGGWCVAGLCRCGVPWDEIDARWLDVPECSPSWIESLGLYTEEIEVSFFFQKQMEANIGQRGGVKFVYFWGKIVVFT